MASQPSSGDRSEGSRKPWDVREEGRGIGRVRALGKEPFVSSEVRECGHPAVLRANQLGEAATELLGEGAGAEYPKEGSAGLGLRDGREVQRGVQGAEGLGGVDRTQDQGQDGHA